MATPVTLVGLDFGTTTSSAVVASAELISGAVGGRVELSHVRERFRSEMVFTPLDDDDRLDLGRIEAQLDAWLSAADVATADVFGGGALLTGLTAERQNAGGLIEVVRRRLGGVLAAAASDPHLESWLAFRGSCGELLREHPDTPILNLDIGGGTTNPALGRGAAVPATDCLYVGARHFRFEPGGYRLQKISRYGRAVLAELGLPREPGESLDGPARRDVLDYYVNILEAVVAGRPIEGPLQGTSVAAVNPAGWNDDLAVTFSGGVGELIYRHFAGHPWPPTTAFGDLGIDLAQRIVESPIADARRCRLRPASTGRATAYGLLRHTTHVSGSTLFLPRPERLPLTDVPILGRLDVTADEVAIRTALDLVRRSPCGGALSVMVDGPSATTDVRSFGTRLAGVIKVADFPATTPLVLLLEKNLGKTLGQYATEWGALDVDLVVIDEVTPGDAQYLQVGPLRSRVVPVSFYGLRPPERF